MNNTQIVGRICSEPERKATASGKSVTSIDVAVKRPFTKDTTDFLTVILWEKKCDYICQYGHKGDMVAVTGMMTTRKWQDKDGNNRTAYEIVCDTVQIVSSAQQNGQNRATDGQLGAFMNQARNAGVQVVDDTDLPF